MASPFESSGMTSSTIAPQNEVNEPVRVDSSQNGEIPENEKGKDQVEESVPKKKKRKKPQLFGRILMKLNSMTV